MYWSVYDQDILLWWFLFSDYNLPDSKIDTDSPVKAGALGSQKMVRRHTLPPRSVLLFSSNLPESSSLSFLSKLLDSLSLSLSLSQT